jgi:glyoxylase I family protein
MQFVVEHIGLAARNTVVLKDWYVQVLSGEVVFQTNDASPAFFVRLPGGCCVEIYSADSQREETGHNRLAGWRHLALRVDSIEAARALLSNRGIRFEEPVKPAGGSGSVLFFRDCEGNLLHLVERPGSFLRPNP